MPRLALTLSVLLAAAALACSSPPPVSETLRIDDVVTGWYDAGVTDDGRNKIVPSISMTIANTGSQPVGPVQLNLIFRRVGDPEEWSTALVRVAGSDGLQPGASSSEVVVRAPQGYTGTQPRAQLLQNSLFVDAKVDVFARIGASTWTRLGEYRIDRQLLTQ
jgi:hypothetical protein